MQRAAVLLAIGFVIAGCGGSTKPTPMTGCRGLPTATTSRSFLVLFGSTPQTTPRFACAHLGAPQKITRRGDGLVDWTYGKAIVTFRGQQAISYTTVGSNGTDIVTVGVPVQAQK